nr:GNAT family N-acetyltransferase [Bradyrhizobium sp. CCBAU 21362]
MSYEVRRLQASDLPSVTKIYNAACRSRESTQGTRPWNLKEMETFLFESHPSFDAYTCVDNSAVVGWTAFTPYRTREDFRHAAEMSIYVQKSARRRGIGSALAHSILSRASSLDLHCILAMTFKDRPEVAFFLENKCGFSVTGCLPEIFSDDGKHYDILTFERLILPATDRH